MGYVHGNIRPENILLKIDEERKKIKKIKFINFGASVKIERATDMILPEQLDHLPPELLDYFIQYGVFCK